MTMYNNLMKNSVVKITHLSSAHPRYDVRIFEKMCKCLAKNENYYITLIIADGKGNETLDKVSIIDVGQKSQSRIHRMTVVVMSIFYRSLKLNSDIYHIHDPELIPIGLLLKLLGKRIVFDSHENISQDILSKPYLPKTLLWFISNLYKTFEFLACRFFSGIVSATPSIRDYFKKINKNTLDINNYPIIDEFTANLDWNNKIDEVCYIGGLVRMRGACEMVDAIGICKNVKLTIIGSIDETGLKNELEQRVGWSNTNYMGVLDRKTLSKLFDKFKAGLVLFHPIPNHIDAQPNKMFEYMSAGIPVIASNFPLWKEIIEKNHCGICVDPLNPNEIAVAITKLIQNPEDAKRMGENGYRAIVNSYNWDIELGKLTVFYNQLLLE